MLGQIIRKEILEHLMSLRFAIACVLCLFVILSSLFVRSRDYIQVLDDYQNNARSSHTDIEETNAPWEWVWDRSEQQIHFPPNPLKIFVQGTEHTNGGAVTLGYRALPTFAVSDLANPSAPLFLTVDFVAFVGIIMSLMAIVFGYDSICGEKERGTLRLMLSYSVPRDRVLLGKWMGGYFTLIIPFSLTVISALAIMQVQSDIIFSSAQWLQLAVVLGISYLYIAAIYSLALWVSSIVPKASTSIMLLITIWVVFILAIPNISPYAASLFKPIEIDKQNLTAKTELVEEVWQREVIEPRQKWGQNQQSNSREEGWINESQLMQKGRLETFRALEKIEEQKNAELEEQTVLSQWLSRFSPYACFAMAVAEVTDSGLGIEQHKMEQALDYQKRFVDYATKEYAYVTQFRLDNNGKNMPNWKSQRLAPVPQFQYVAASSSGVWKQIAVDVGIIIAIIILFFMLSFMSFLKYDVR